MPGITLNEKNGVKYFTFDAFENAGGVNHLFSTRIGGVSDGIYSSMNLGFSLGDSRENVTKNFERLTSCIGVDPKNLVFSKQTHTTNIKYVTESERGIGFLRDIPYDDVDGLITDREKVALVTFYADCVPLLFFDPQKRVIAASHSGWKGTAGRIGFETVKRMTELGCQRDNILAAIGPCISKCCYEVSADVASKFMNLQGVDPKKILTKKDDGKFMLDLVETNRQILLSAGLKPENITVSNVCTCCNSDLLHSHRATGGKRGSLVAIIELKK